MLVKVMLEEAMKIRGACSCHEEFMACSSDTEPVWE